MHGRLDKSTYPVRLLMRVTIALVCKCVAVLPQGTPLLLANTEHNLMVPAKLSDHASSRRFSGSAKASDVTAKERRSRQARVALFMSCFGDGSVVRRWVLWLSFIVSAGFVQGGLSNS